ncbi:MAG: hypothetical protein K6B64_04325 [Acholeplasmatales bacterium]|nr:hypothetical protein [Acholeplasmatales bacterium]
METNDFQKRIIQEFVSRGFKIQILKKDTNMIYMTNCDNMTVEIYPERYMVFNAKYKNIFTEDKTEPGSKRNWKKKRYDKNGNMTHSETSTGEWDDYSYDKYDQLIKHVSSTGKWEQYSYTIHGSQCYYTNSSGFWEKCEYDDNNRLIHKYNSDYHWRYSFPEMGIDIDGIKNKYTKIRVNKESYRLNRSRYNNYHALLATGLMTENLGNKTFSKLELFLYENLTNVLKIEENKEIDRQKALIEERKRKKRYQYAWDK